MARRPREAWARPFAVTAAARRKVMTPTECCSLASCRVRSSLSLE